MSKQRLVGRNATADDQQDAFSREGRHIVSTAWNAAPAFTSVAAIFYVNFVEFSPKAPRRQPKRPNAMNPSAMAMTHSAAVCQQRP
jgi:hypothetical protein